MPKKDREIEVKIYSLATTLTESTIFLEEAEGNRLLPIWIGLSEGQAIAIRFSGVVLPRPLTHDLLLAVIKSLGWTVTKVSVSDIKDNTFYAEIRISKNGKEHVIDSRPSDAIALAVRAGCSIYVNESVFERCQVLTKPITEDEVTKFKEDLKHLKPEDIFKDIQGKSLPSGPEASEEPGPEKTDDE